MITRAQFKKMYFDVDIVGLNLGVVESIIDIAYSNFRLGYIIGKMEEVSADVDFDKQDSKKGHKVKNIVEETKRAGERD